MVNGKYKIENNGVVVVSGLSYNDAYRALHEYGESGGKVRMMPDVPNIERISKECKECGGVH